MALQRIAIIFLIYVFPGELIRAKISAIGENMVSAAGIEPATHALKVHCSTD
jgi:hypothetical protein